MATLKYGKVPSGHPFGSQLGVNFSTCNSRWTTLNLVQICSFSIRLITISSRLPATIPLGEIPNGRSAKPAPGLRFIARRTSLMGAIGSRQQAGIGLNCLESQNLSSRDHWVFNGRMAGFAKFFEMSESNFRLLRYVAIGSIMWDHDLGGESWPRIL